MFSMIYPLIAGCIWLVGFIIVARNLWINYRRRKRWHNLAAHFDLDVVSMEILSGTWEGRPVTIDKFTVTTTIIRQLPIGFVVQNAKADLEDRIYTGDSAFDEKFAVTGDDKEATLELLSAEVRDAISVYAKRNGNLKLDAQTLECEPTDYTSFQIARILDDQRLLIECLMDEQAQRLLAQENEASAHSVKASSGW